jgi:PucR C-terminal helix-turn-helix domain/GGDEF-like domain
VDLSSLADSMQAEVTHFAARVTAETWGLSGYDEEHMMRGDYAQRVGPSIELVLEQLRAEHPPDEKELAHAEAIGEVRALQGVPVDTVLHAWMAMQRTLISGILEYAAELAPDDLRDACQRVLARVELLTRTSVVSYRRTQEAVSNTYDGPSADFVVAVAGPQPPDAEGMRRWAGLLNAVIDVPYTAIALAARAPSTDLQLAQRHIHRALRTQLRERVLVGQVKHLTVFLIPHSEPSEHVRHLLCEAAADQVCPRSLVIAVGSRVPSLDHVGVSLRQATQTAEIGTRVEGLPAVISVTNIVPELLLSQHRDLADLLTDDRLGPIRDRPSLVDTLESYIRNRLSVRRTAAALYVHPNTVMYRLDRIREALGDGFQDDGAFVDLGVAIRAHRLLAQQPANHAEARQGDRSDFPDRGAEE